MRVDFLDMSIGIRYRSNENKFPRDFLVPVLQRTAIYKRAVGFFSSTALIELSVGLFDMAKKGGKIYLIASPRLSEEDIEAIRLGYKTKDCAITESLNLEITEPLDYFEEERLNLIATLIANGMLEIKLAFMEENIYKNLYHEKIAVFIDDEGNKIAYTGSMNDSSNAYYDNFESIFTFCSWKDQSQIEAVEYAERDFDRMWNNETLKIRVLPFPQIVLEKLARFRKDTIDYTIDEQQFHYNEFIKKRSLFHVPDSVILRKYQKDAIRGWIKQNYCGIFSMCTGSGKSYTALAGMVNLAEKVDEKLAVFIICPYIHLVGQWEEDVVSWGPNPIIAHSNSPDKKWKDNLIKSYKRFRNNGKPFICITTNDTFAGDIVQSVVTRLNNEQHVLLIVDEAHNFGSENLSKFLPENVNYRIALSATIERHLDKKGTKRLFDYFGDKCITYDLEKAIYEKALVRYKYHPVVVYLDSDELAEYQNMTEQLKKFMIKENEKIKISEAGQLLLFKRSRLLAGARNKSEMLISLMEPYKNKQSILVYCGATFMEDEETGELSRQIDGITSKIQKDLGMRAHRFTAEEGLNERKQIKAYFEEGLYQVITAIKCLDEGVNIPSIKTAFILASSRNPKEFIQRRGRLLRQSTNKVYAEIYDFVTLPRRLEDVCYGDFEKDRTIILGELARINEFGKLSHNPIEAESLITKIMDSYDTFVNIEAEMDQMEEYYG